MEGLIAHVTRAATRHRRLLIIWAGVALGLGVSGWISWQLLVLQLPLLGLFLSTSRLRAIGRFVYRLWHHEEASGRHVELWFARELKGKIEPQEHLQCWDSVVEELAIVLDYQLPFRPIILLVPTNSELEGVLGVGIPAVAFSRIHTIAVSLEAVALGVLSEELMRHELAHLFTANWGSTAPPFKGEGLATWLQESNSADLIDLHALAHLLEEPSGSLQALCNPAVFRAQRSRNYLLSGSFTGFLVKSHGWPAYRSWYGQATSRNCAASFQQHFAIDLETAERAWREELFARQGDFEPALSWELRRRVISRAMDENQWMEALEEIQALQHEGLAKARDLRNGFHCHLMLGHYTEAITYLTAHLEAREDSRPNLTSGEVWLSLGWAYAQADDPEQAERAYRQCLLGRDFPYSKGKWGHAEAHRRLEKLQVQRSQSGKPVAALLDDRAGGT